MERSCRPNPPICGKEKILSTSSIRSCFVCNPTHNSNTISLLYAPIYYQKRITKNSFSQPNGHQYYASPTQVQSLLQHIQTYQSPYTDLRPSMRRIEHRLLTEYAGLLIGNQCLDFGKQDGVTEMEESTMANSVERKLNDMLFQDEQDGKIGIIRKPIFVSWWVVEAYICFVY